MKNLLIEELLLTEFNRHFLKPYSGEHVFRFCTFEEVSDLERQMGAEITACFLYCTFSDCGWYDPHFNQAFFLRTKFERCTFQGGSFGGCYFVDCEFVDCRFECNAHGRPCTFDDDVRWYDCKRRGSPGLEGQF